MNQRAFRVKTDRYLETCSVADVSREKGHYWLALERGDPESLRSLLKSSGLHPLAIEACLDPAPAARLLAYGHSLFIGFPTIVEGNTVERSHLWIVCLPGLLITIQEHTLPVLENIIAQYQESLRFHAADTSSILYQILDHLIDEDMANTLRTREALDQIEALVDRELFEGVAEQVVPLKRQLMRLAATLEDQLYCFSSLQTIESESFSVEGLIDYFRDALSHLEHASRSISRQLSRLNAVQQEFQLKMQDKTNDRLKLLTIISTIFLPLTLITGIYGMNFDHMPELQWRFGYFGVLLTMLGVALAMLWGFYRQDWFK